MATRRSDGSARTDPAKAAKAALAAVLRQRVALWAELDAELARLIDRALAEITAQLARAPSDYQQWVLPRLVDGVRRVADALAVSSSTRASDGMRRAWSLGEQAVTAPVSAAQAAEAMQVATGAAAPMTAVPTVALGTPDLRQLRALQAVNTHLISGATTDLVTAINRELGQVVLGARSPFEAIQRVQTLLPERTRNQVRGIVTTNLGTAFNTASHAALEAQAARDPLLRKQWRRSGKLHSRWNHDLADGQVQDVGTPFELVAGDGRGTVHLMYPADPAAPVGEVIHCGCVALPWKAGWKMRVPAAKALTPQEVTARREDAAQKAGRRLPVLKPQAARSKR